MSPSAGTEMLVWEVQTIVSKCCSPLLGRKSFLEKLTEQTPSIVYRGWKPNEVSLFLSVNQLVTVNTFNPFDSRVSDLLKAFSLRDS